MSVVEKLEEQIKKCEQYCKHSDGINLRKEFVAFKKDYDFVPKREEWEESISETFSKISDEINRQLKFHGIFRSDTSIIIDPKQNKFVIVPRKKLEERAYDYLTDGTMDGIAVSNYIKEELLGVEKTK